MCLFSSAPARSGAHLFLAFWLLWGPFVMGWRAAPMPPRSPLTQSASSSTSSSTTPAPAYTITNTVAGMVLTWQLDATQAAGASADQRGAQQWAAVLAQLPQVRFGNYLLPMLLETVLLPAGTVVTPHIEQLEAERWTAALAQSEPLTPTVLAGESLGPPTFREGQTTPTAPVFLLREGQMRGIRLGVVAVSPLYVEAGVTKIARHVRATIPGAITLSAPLPALTARDAAPYHTTMSGQSSILDFTRFTNQPVALQPPASGPTNEAATKDAFKIQVSHAGIQRLRGPALLEAGLNEGLVLTSLQLAYQGTPLALEIRDSDGLLDAATELRFYARPAANSLSVGDRWNATDTYWLTSEPTGASLPMPTRNAFPVAAPLRQTAYERGIWEENTIYESTMTGVDGDHWFGAKLEIETVQPDNPASYPVKAITLTHRLPLDYGSSASSVFTLTGSSRSIATHTLQVNLGAVMQPLTWSNQRFYENWQHTFTQTVQTDHIDLVLIAVLDPSMIRVDKIGWQQPVQLDFSAQGAVFTGVPGWWRYQLQNTPGERTLYDITEPTTPVVLQIPGGPQTQFEDGPLARTYLLTGPGTLHTPTIMHHTPVAFLTTSGADAIYIAPGWLHAALTPLIEYRRQQGYQVALVDVDQLYAAWSYGQVAPEAIRTFLRYAVSYWRPAPIAVTLVGDSTLDPRNYSGVQNGVANVNVLPAYLAPIDPWISETACESCFAQLDGADPFDPAYDASFLVDIYLGRLSVQDEEQLKTVVDKILRYEASAQRDPGALWHRTALYVADNYIHLDGSKDPAGNFPYLSDLIINGDVSKGIGAAQPPQVLTRRLYYDPSADGLTHPWREPNAALARQRTIAEINQGPGLVTYNGHGNHFLWATTDPNYEPPYLFGANDVFELTNVEQPSILLEMTCYTAQFTYISPSGTTIDERFFRHTNGGAVAVWGSAGLTIAVGHDWMQQGFHRKLWQSPPFQAHLGELVAAGYAELFAATTCCQETRYVYVLLGDPLTPALIWTPTALYLPLIARP